MSDKVDRGSVFNSVRIAHDKRIGLYKDLELEQKEVVVQKYDDRVAYIRSDQCQNPSIKEGEWSQCTSNIISVRENNVYIGHGEDPVTRLNLSESIQNMLSIARDETSSMRCKLSIKSFSVIDSPTANKENLQNETTTFHCNFFKATTEENKNIHVQLSKLHPLYKVLLDELVLFAFNIHDKVHEYHNKNNISKRYKVNDDYSLKDLNDIDDIICNMGKGGKATERLLCNIINYSNVGVKTTNDFHDKTLNLSKDYPNMHKVYNYIIQSMTVNKHTKDELFYFKPLLIVGPKGIGKTSFLYKMANLIDLPCSKVDFSGVSANFVLVGSTGQWSGAEHGKIFESLSKSYPISCVDGEKHNIYKYEEITFKNPIFILDELDKCSTTDHRDPYGVLHGLLEKDTAKEFTDEYVNFPIDASKINWVATANDVTSIPETILDRFYIIELEDLKEKEFLVMAKSVYKDFSKDIVKECKPISDQCILSLHKAGLGLRQFQKMLYLAFEGFDNYTQINETKIAKLIQDMSNKKLKIGF